MRQGRLSLFLALVIMLLSLQIIAPASALEQTSRRVIEVNENGLVYVYDVLPAAGDTTRIGFPKEFLKNLVNYACREDSSPELVVEDNFFWIVVDSASGTETHLLTIFRDVLSWSPADQTFSMKIPAHPRVEDLGRSDFSVEVRLPADAMIAEISPGWLNQTKPSMLSGELRDLDLSRGEVNMISVKFSSNSLRILDIISAKLLVEVPEGRASISLKMRLVGGPQLGEIKLRLPEGFELIGAEDALGRLSSSISEAGEAVIRLRQPLSQGGSDLFTVVAKINETSSMIKLGADEVSIIALPMPLNTTIWVYDVEICLRGGGLKSWNPEPIELRREYPERTVLSYRFDNVDPINASSFKKMKKGVYIINTARGKIIDTDALLWALENGIVKAAALDVFDPEPIPPNHPILKMENVILTPHIAFAASKTCKMMDEYTIEEALRILRGEKPLWIVNPEVLKRDNLRARIRVS